MPLPHTFACMQEAGVPGPRHTAPATLCFRLVGPCSAKQCMGCAHVRAMRGRATPAGALQLAADCMYGLCMTARTASSAQVASYRQTQKRAGNTARHSHVQLRAAGSGLSRTANAEQVTRRMRSWSACAIMCFDPSQVPAAVRLAFAKQLHSALSSRGAARG